MSPGQRGPGSRRRKWLCDGEPIGYQRVIWRQLRGVPLATTTTSVPRLGAFCREDRAARRNPTWCLHPHRTDSPSGWHSPPDRQLSSAPLTPRRLRVQALPLRAETLGGDPVGSGGRSRGERGGRCCSRRGPALRGLPYLLLPEPGLVLIAKVFWEKLIFGALAPLPLQP